MLNNRLHHNGNAPATLACARPAVTAEITLGVCRYLVDCGYAPLTEFTLANGRRADIAAIDKAGHILIVEVKSCREDFEGDAKWPDYLGFCDQFYFAVSADFPKPLLPDGIGFLVADRYGAALGLAAPDHKMAAARRKAVTVRLARQSLLRGLTKGG